MIAFMIVVWVETMNPTAKSHRKLAASLYMNGKVQYCIKWPNARIGHNAVATAVASVVIMPGPLMKLILNSKRLNIY